MITSSPSSSSLSSASVTTTATSISASRRRSRPVISQSIHTRRSATTAEAIRRGYGGLEGHRRREANVAANLLDQAEIDEQLSARHPGWRGSPETLQRSIEFADFPTAVEFISRVAPRCEEMDHHPDLDLRW